MSTCTSSAGLRIRLGIVGLGAISPIQQDALLALPALYELSAACDTDGSRACVCRAPAFYDDLVQMLAEVPLDAVLISTPPARHMSVAEVCMRAGKDVLLEKPAALCLAQAERMYRTAEEKGVLLRTAYHAAYGAEIGWFLKNRARLAREYGWENLRRIRCTFCDPYVCEGRIRAGREALGGSWADSGINALSVAMRLTDLRAGFAETESASEQIVGCTVRAQKVYAGNGVTLEIRTAWDDERNYKATELFFDGARTSLLLNHSLQQAELLTDGRRRILFRHAKEERLTHQYRALFSDYAAQWRSRSSDREETLALHRMLFASP